jgi:DeoR family transcriptional regulator, fructose operon transcriptional repressor
MPVKRTTRTRQSRNTHQRRQAILEKLSESQEMSVSDLSRHFGISEVSIRRDLEHLEQTGLLQRKHGGARMTQQTSIFEARLYQNSEVKRAIGKAGAQLIQPGDIILLDSGTTVLEVARHIPDTLLEDNSLTILTRSLMIASEFRLRRHTRLILLGGIYVHDYDDFVGEPVERALERLHVQKLFLGVDGVSLERGLTTDNILEAGLFKRMVESADWVIVTVDSSKIGVNKLQSILPIDAVHTFVTDDAAPEPFIDNLRERGIEVILVPRHADEEGGLTTHE